ncbi:MAG TPA: DNA-3-methyladenine glycosylase [Nitrososphaerales archaeon]|jgi:DNA-3-methyladenine glycosylase|nr:DNA-3-methyladenine glycosylase [Nitrososphaerales archaeon]|tara:strand:- start:7810 stop:8412 length:603 start_codon:yes stop_codon:yes gene_type:complete
MTIEKQPINRRFYTRDTLKVAKAILGKVLVRRTPLEVFTGKIVETEAYRGTDDPASHSFRGKTNRNEVMFGKPGITYVYFTYGNHHCLNIVTERTDIPAAVLIRSIEPLKGIETMKRNRSVEKIIDVASGPGKLTKAFQITREDNNIDVTDFSSNISIHTPVEEKSFQIVQTTRIGIRLAQEFPWRFYIKENPHVSKRKI